VRATVATSGFVGAVAGVASGLFGVGGGIVIVPCLVYLARMDQRRAQALSLVAIIPIAVSGTLGYALDAQVDWSVAALIATGGVVGALVGTELLHRAPIRALQLTFAAAALITSVELFLHTPDHTGAAALSLPLAAAYVAVGVGAGIASGLLGVGGGIVVVPVLTLLFGFPTVLAKGTSLAYMIPTAIIGGLRNLRNGHAELTPALLVGGAGVLTALGAARLSLTLDPVISASLLAALLTTVAIHTTVRALRAQPVAIAGPEEHSDGR
jgi:uncharacterized membrane protein YfcA